MLLDGSVVATGDARNLLTAPPIGGTVAIGSACILDTVLTIGGTATVGKTCVRVPVSTGCMTAAICCLTAALLSPVCNDVCGAAMEGAGILSAVCWG